MLCEPGALDLMRQHSMVLRQPLPLASQIIFNLFMKWTPAADTAPLGMPPKLGRQ